MHVWLELSSVLCVCTILWLHLAMHYLSCAVRQGLTQEVLQSFNSLEEVIHGLQRFNRVNAKYGRDAFGEVYCIVTFTDIPVGLVG